MASTARSGSCSDVRPAGRTRRPGARVKTLAPFLLAAVLAAVGLAGCDTPLLVAEPRAAADALAAEHGFRRADYDAGRFHLRGYERFAKPGARLLAVYIESDGRAWLDRWTLSGDPTPPQPDILKLATEDPSPNRLYLARPCQYLAPAALRGCSPAYWADARFAPEVIDGYQAAIDAAKRRAGATQVALFGYSGGGAVAALVAAGRRDVALLVPISAPLDTARWTRDAGISPLARSLNPADAAPRLQSVRQVVFVGTDDEVVPPAVARSYLARMSDRRQVTLVPVKGFDHNCCWVDRWPALLARYVYGRRG